VEQVEAEEVVPDRQHNGGAEAGLLGEPGLRTNIKVDTVH
jgi:hypothetical protein